MLKSIICTYMYMWYMSLTVYTYMYMGINTFQSQLVSGMWGILSSVNMYTLEYSINTFLHLTMYMHVFMKYHPLYRTLTGSKLRSMCLSRPPTIPSWSDYTPVSRQTAGGFTVHHNMYTYVQWGGKMNTKTREIGRKGFNERERLTSVLFPLQAILCDRVCEWWWPDVSHATTSPPPWGACSLLLGRNLVSAQLPPWERYVRPDYSQFIIVFPYLLLSPTLYTRFFHVGVGQVSTNLKVIERLMCKGSRVSPLGAPLWMLPLVNTLIINLHSHAPIRTHTQRTKVSFIVTWSSTMFCWIRMVTLSWLTTVCARRACVPETPRPPSVELLITSPLKS